MDDYNPRTEALHLARRYADRAARMATSAENKLHASERHMTGDYATVGTLYADVSRVYAAIATATPEPEPTPAEEN
ncbi:hypothetical protein H9W91_17470 [Streptomyces alfalfae]|uniref:hypothetical protein n=1 Tax=Streptomyces alfalfae TaxID=1642299 RepID=UPI001BA8C775|nr:hypothetical protein [Streptomyces alfalfae]QUI32451.1 hypothetical protein H9W91_17470 [Streptomyces alfalfae]